MTNGERERTETIVAEETSEALYVNTRAGADITIKKTVTGNMGDKYQLFDFEIYIVDEGRELEGAYPVTVTNEDGDTVSRQLTFTEGAAVIQLRHGDTAVVTRLPVGVRYEVDELAASRREYRYTSTNETGSLGKEGVTTEWVNSKGVAVPTGGLDWKFPGIMFLVVMGTTLAVFIFSGKKKRK